MQFKKLAVLASALMCTGLAASDVLAQGRDNDRRAGRWVELGCQQVSLFGKDHDTVRVGRREGRFKAIRLHARGADVELRSVRVIYTNGQPDDLPTRHFLRQGGYTPPLDLRGWERAIDRVDMVYKTVPNFKGIATVCVEGLQ